MYKKSGAQVQSDITNLRSTMGAIQGNIWKTLDAELADVNAVIAQLQVRTKSKKHIPPRGRFIIPTSKCI